MKDILNNNRICIRTFIWTQTLQELRKAIVSIEKIKQLVLTIVPDNISEKLSNQLGRH